MRHNQHPVVTEPDMGGLHNHRQTIQQDDPVAPVKLIGFSKRKARRPANIDIEYSGELTSPTL
jgi:hypothetical protein